MANSRFNITLSEELKEWYVKRASSYGMSVSSLMVMALAYYKEQQEGIKALSEASIYLKDLEALREKINEK